MNYLQWWKINFLGGLRFPWFKKEGMGEDLQGKLIFPNVSLGWDKANK